MKSLTARLIALFILNSCACFASPLDDLMSPIQETRDKAAMEVRKTFRATPREKWTPVVNQISKGQSKKEILALLRPFKVTDEGGNGSGQSHSQSYRLDNEWLLIGWFENEGDVLIGRELVPSVKHLWVAPPKDFTGVWEVYFINGQKSHRIQYKEGRYEGEFIAYHSNGSKAYVQHYTTIGADGKDTGYYPSGKISYEGQYKANKQAGTWTWYDEAGKVRNTEEHGEPDLKGKAGK